LVKVEPPVVGQPGSHGSPYEGHADCEPTIVIGPPTRQSEPDDDEYVFKHTLAASFQRLFAAAFRRVRVRVDVILEFVLADVRRGESERLG